MSTQTTTEPLVTVDELAEYLRKPRSWIYNRLRDLGIPHVRVGNQLRFRMSEVERWLDEGQVAA